MDAAARLEEGFLSSVGHTRHFWSGFARKQVHRKQAHWAMHCGGETRRGEAGVKKRGHTKATRSRRRCAMTDAKSTPFSDAIGRSVLMSGAGDCKFVSADQHRRTKTRFSRVEGNGTCTASSILNECDAGSIICQGCHSRALGAGFRVVDETFYA